MSVNYYNSVTVNVSGKENAYSLSNALYSLGDKLSKLSGMYGGKAYTIHTIDFSDGKKGIIVGSPEGSKKTTFMKKISAAAGFSLKWIAALFNSEIRNKHLAVQKWENGSIDPIELSDLKEVGTRRITKKVKGEGADVGPELMVGCCFEFCAHMCCCK